MEVRDSTGKRISRGGVREYPGQGERGFTGMLDLVKVRHWLR